jgi:hypothetical protein
VHPFVVAAAFATSPPQSGTQSADRPGVLAALGAWLSIKPIRNILSSGQVANTTFNPFHLVGTQGAFGGITRIPNELVVEGTMVFSDNTQWKKYEFRGKPTSTGRRPPRVYALSSPGRLAHVICGVGSYQENPWFGARYGESAAKRRTTVSLVRRIPRPPSRRAATLNGNHFTTPPRAEVLASGGPDKGSDPTSGCVVPHAVVPSAPGATGLPR